MRMQLNSIINELQSIVIMIDSSSLRNAFNSNIKKLRRSYNSLQIADTNDIETLNKYIDLIQSDAHEFYYNPSIHDGGITDKVFIGISNCATQLRKCTAEYVYVE